MQLKIMTNDGFKIVSGVTAVRACPSHHERGPHRFEVLATDDGEGFEVLERLNIHRDCPEDQPVFGKCVPDIMEVPGAEGLKPGERLCVAGAYLTRPGIDPDEHKVTLAVFHLAYLMEDGETIERIN
jgi:hypothetical protein